MHLNHHHSSRALQAEVSDTAAPTSHLARIPFEIIESILIVTPLVDVSAFAQTCRKYRNLVYQPIDNHLWRTLFLYQEKYDDPRCIFGPDAPIPWQQLLQRWTAAGRALHAHAPIYSPEVLKSLIEMTDCARPAQKPMALDSHTLRRLHTLLRSSGFFNSDTLCLWADSTVKTDKQMLSRLRVYAGLEAVIPTAARRLRARSFVYDLRNYNSSNYHGPFYSDGSGRVNWLHVHAIQEVIAMNIMDFVDTGETELLPMTLSHIQPQSIPGRSNDERDWAGLGGKWQVVFCFCDHRDLLAFNRLGEIPNEPDPSIFEDEFEEALRFLEFELRLVSVDAESSSCPAYRRGRPTLHFEGTVSGNARVKGEVLMTPDEQVRWSFCSGEPGQMIWSTEAVQIGGVASAFGALGSWTTIVHDFDDPAGPMWLWKLPD